MERLREEGETAALFYTFRALHDLLPDHPVESGPVEQREREEEVKKEKRRVSFSTQPKVWRPVITESLDEHLCRVLGFVTSSEDRISAVVIRRMQEFLERSARALKGGLGLFMEFQDRFTKDDAEKWQRFLEEKSMEMDELNNATPPKVAHVKFTQRDVEALAKAAQNPPAHEFEQEQISCKCADCGSMQDTWCSHCEACEKCANDTGRLLCDVRIPELAEE